MSNRKWSQKEKDAKKEEEEDEERQPLFNDNSKWEKPEQRTCRAFFGKCCFLLTLGHVRFKLAVLLILFAFFLLVIGSFRLSNVKEILMHPSLFPDYVEHFEHSLNSIGQDSTWFDSIKASRPKTYSKQEKARLDLSNNPNHFVWGSASSTQTQGKQPLCAPVNETYLLMVLNTPSAITSNMDSFVTMSTEQNHFIVSRTYDFLPAHPVTLKEKTAKEKTMTTYFSNFVHKTVSVSSTPYLNFEQFQMTEPVYIGTIRDPISRLQSQYESKWGGHDSTRTSSKSFQACVRAFIRSNISASHLMYGTDSKQLESLGLPYPITRKISQVASKHTCFSSEYLNVQVQAYCGLDCEQLQKDTAEESLREAIAHMNERFRVILLAEQLHASVQLLETVVPDFFSGLNAKASSILKMFSTPLSPPTLAPTPVPSPSPTAVPTPAPVRLPPQRCPGDQTTFCVCPGTIYYGKAFVNGHKYEAGGTGPMCTLEELMALPHLSKDVSAEGGAYCSKKSLGRDPYFGYSKQCICDPNKPTLHQSPHPPRNLRMLNESKSLPPDKGGGKTGNSWKLSPQVYDYLKAVLSYEYRLYAAAKQHLSNNVEQCKMVKTLPSAPSASVEANAQ